jgi:hypothetical protein
MELTKEDWLHVREQVETQLKQQAIGVEINEAILKFVDHELAKLAAKEPAPAGVG